MDKINLKEYTKRAVELEAAIYTQKKLMDEHEEIILKRKPSVSGLANPQRPIEPRPPRLLSEKIDPRGIIVSICAIFTGLCLIVLGPAGIVLGLFIVAFGFFWFFAENKKKRDNISANAKNMTNYHNQIKEYYQQKKQYDEDFVNYELSKLDAEEKYQSEMLIYKTTKKQHTDVLCSLKQKLSELYAQDIIYPKYRNMVAITTINEYLMSGRCAELEGADGAYNLYEMELRQNIVINQLSSIMSNLEQIRESQFLLYQELIKANTTINEILYEIEDVNENTRLTAYFAGVTALIEASPKVTYGYIH